MKHFIFTNCSWSELRKKFKVGNSTLIKVFNTYKKHGNDLVALKNIYTNRSRCQIKNHNDNSCIEYIEEIFQKKFFEKNVTAMDIRSLLIQRFPEFEHPTLRKTYYLLKKSGLRRRKSKLKVLNFNRSVENTAAKSDHVLRLLRLLNSNYYLVFLDETYVNNHLIQNKIWCLQENDRYISVPPKNKRLTILAACSLERIEGYQIIYDSFDSELYATFLLTLEQK